MKLLFDQPPSERIKQSTEGPLIVTKSRRRKAVLLAVSDEEELERFVLAHTPRFMGLLDRAEKRIKKRGGVRHNDFWEAIKKKQR